jgi:hypothetical protein
VSSNQASRFSLVTEHGTGNTDDPTNGAIWNEKLTVNEFREKEEPKKIPEELAQELLEVLVVQEIGERASVSERGPLSNPVDVRGRDRASVFEPHIRKRARRQHRVYTEAVPVLLRIHGYKFFFYSLEDREPPHIRRLGVMQSSGLIH